MDADHQPGPGPKVPASTGKKVTLGVGAGVLTLAGGFGAFEAWVWPRVTKEVTATLEPVIKAQSAALEDRLQRLDVRMDERHARADKRYEAHRHGDLYLNRESALMIFQDQASQDEILMLMAANDMLHERILCLERELMRR